MDFVKCSVFTLAGERHGTTEMTTIIIILLSAHPPLNYQLLKHNLIVVRLIRIIILSLLVHTNLTTAVSIPFSPDPAKPARTAWPARDNA